MALKLPKYCIFLNTSRSQIMMSLLSQVKFNTASKLVIYQQGNRGMLANTSTREIAIGHDCVSKTTNGIILI